jgi:hypothetical protein
MDPQLLIDPSASHIPAPYWFVQFFKCLGFTLHAVPMNLWYAGFLIALWLHLRGDQHARRFAARLLQQMPVIVSLGVNFGVVPLLFVQLAYYKVFYPATILMAWHWMAIIGLLIPAYYGVYAYSWGIRNLDIKGTVPFSSDSASQQRPRKLGQSLAGWRIAGGWLAAIFFIVIGFLFVNGLSLMDHPGRWHGLWLAHSEAGSALGTGLNVCDPTLWPRWLLMFGMALGTTAVWLLVDAYLLQGDAADEAYRRWAWSFAGKLYTVAMIWFAASGSWYVFGTWSDELRSRMFEWPLLPLTALTAVAMGLPWMLIVAGRNFLQPRMLAALVVVCQFGVLGINAISRQTVQNVNLKLVSFDVMAQAENVQWGPLVMFLVVFVLGLGVIGWMLAQVRNSQES